MHATFSKIIKGQGRSAVIVGNSSELIAAGWEGDYALELEAPTGNTTCEALRLLDLKGTSLLWKTLRLEQGADYRITIQMASNGVGQKLGLVNAQAVIFPCHTLLHPDMEAAVREFRLASGESDVTVGPPPDTIEFHNEVAHISMRYAESNDRILLALGSGGRQEYFVRLVRVEKVPAGTYEALKADGFF